MRNCSKCGQNTDQYYNKARVYCIECERKDARYRMASFENRARQAQRFAQAQAEKYGVRNDLTVDDVLYLYTIAGGRCAYTGKFSNNLSVEHVIPMSLGGGNTIGNVVVVDLGVNKAKRDRSFFDYLESHCDHRDITPLISLLASRGNRTYNSLYFELFDHQARDFTEWYQRKLKKQEAKAGSPEERSVSA